MAIPIHVADAHRPVAPHPIQCPQFFLVFQGMAPGVEDMDYATIIAAVPSAEPELPGQGRHALCTDRDLADSAIPGIGNIEIGAVGGDVGWIVKSCRPSNPVGGTRYTGFPARVVTVPVATSTFRIE